MELLSPHQPGPGQGPGLDALEEMIQKEKDLIAALQF